MAVKKPQVQERKKKFSLSWESNRCNFLLRLFLKKKKRENFLKFGRKSKKRTKENIKCERKNHKRERERETENVMCSHAREKQKKKKKSARIIERTEVLLFKRNEKKK